MNRIGIYVVGGLIALLVAFSTLCIVDQRQFAVIYALGEIKEVVTEPGLKFKLPPPFQNVVFLDRRTQTLDSPETRPNSKGFTGTTCEQVLNGTQAELSFSGQNRTTMNSNMFFNKIFLGPTQTQYLERRVNAARARTKKTTTTVTTTRVPTTTVTTTTLPVQSSTAFEETTTKQVPISTTKPSVSTTMVQQTQPTTTTTTAPVTTTTTATPETSPFLSTKSAVVLNELVTPAITSCENGGLLIYNI